MMSKTEHKALTDLSQSLCKVCGPKLAAWLEEHKVKPKRVKTLALKDGEVDRAEFVRALTECVKVARRACGGSFGENVVRVAFARHAFNTLMMRATDGEVFVQRDFEYLVEEPYLPRPERVLDATPMLRWLKTRKGKALAVKVGEGAVAFGDGGSAMAFTFLPTLEDGGPFLPSAPDGDWTRLAAMPAPDVVSMFRRTAFAASDKELRYAMNAVRLEAGGRKGALKLEAAAMDGRRLAVVGPLEGGEAKGEALVPLPAVASIQKLLRDDGDSTVSLSVMSVGDKDKETGCQPTFFRAESGRSCVVARCVVGRFPSYHDVIPKEFVLKVVADKAALENALKSVSAFTIDEDRDWRAVVMEVGKGEITFRSTVEEHVDKRFSVPARIEGGVEWEKIGWRAVHILDALAAVDDGEVTVEFGGVAGAVMVLSQADFRYVLMFVGLRGEPDEEPA